MTDLSSPEIQATFKNNRVAVILTDYYALNGDTWGGMAVTYTDKVHGRAKVKTLLPQERGVMIEKL